MIKFFFCTSEGNSLSSINTYIKMFEDYKIYMITIEEIIKEET